MQMTVEPMDVISSQQTPFKQAPPFFSDRRSSAKIEATDLEPFTAVDELEFTRRFKDIVNLTEDDNDDATLLRAENAYKMQPYHRQSLSLDASDGNSGFNSRLFSTSQLTRDNHPSEFQGRSFSHQPSPRRVRQEKSFLDDDWLLDRVENDSNMAMVAAGLVRPRSAVHFDERSRTPNSSTSMFPPFHQSYQDPTACREDDFYAPLKQPALSNPPPRDYICKLCNVPGHWLKDCELFEPRNGASVKGFGLTGHKNNVMPPGNYICRLCGISGHWIEQCTQFQPKTDNKGHQKDNRDRLNCFKSIPPPPGYVCNLCHQPGHWLQQCTKFEPMPMHRRKEHFFNR